jgi:hypothetical protein
MTWDDRLAAITALGAWFGLTWAALSWASRHTDKETRS